jgi:MFS superfamily sulfate permease-like transporter
LNHPNKSDILIVVVVVVVVVVVDFEYLLNIG